MKKIFKKNKKSFKKLLTNKKINGIIGHTHKKGVQKNILHKGVLL